MVEKEAAAAEAMRSATEAAAAEATRAAAEAAEAEAKRVAAEEAAAAAAVAEEQMAAEALATAAEATAAAAVQVAAEWARKRREREVQALARLWGQRQRERGLKDHEFGASLDAMMEETTMAIQQAAARREQLMQSVTARTSAVRGESERSAISPK